ncbi:adenosylhomocysteinase [Caldisphaera sp.]|uniref:adenosylhomocysteinase n=1 Tax=Caldisphaera sp. TaxID=2060322 RepID=UPI0025C41085|nr:adenosylhomocysteinase [Caldisphaera sp.]
MNTSKIKKPELYKEGNKKIEFAEMHMPVVMKLRELYLKEKPLEGIKISAALHVTKETAVLIKTLQLWGAQIFLSPSNPLSTQDDVAASLANIDNLIVEAWRGMTNDEYFMAIKDAAKFKPDIVIDDGADLHITLHEEMPGVAEKILGGNEETTTGVIRLKALEKENKLLYPVMAVNNALTKFMFDNRYGTGQSSIDGVLRSTNILIAGKKAVVAGYGWVGRGIAQRLKGLGARVIVTEVDPIKALEAVMDGFDVMTMEEASKIGDIFITATGDIDVIRAEHMLNMKEGAILANAGHFNVEVSVKDLETISDSKEIIRENNVKYTLRNGKHLFLLGEGRLVNLVAAEGHPSEVMDMSFANQALSVLYLIKNKGKLEKKVYNVPYDQDQYVAKLKLETMNIKIDELTPEQEKYLESYK